MNKSVDYDEMEILDLYERYESAKPVAAKVGVSSQTVYRVLIKHGVKRTHRHDLPQPKTKRPNGCNTKYCPALVVMLRTILDMRFSEIVSATGYTQSAVGNIIARHGLTDKRRRRDIDEQTIDAIEAEYLAGASTYKIAEKYGVCHETISRWMNKRGHYRGKGQFGSFAVVQQIEAAKRFKSWVGRTYEGRFTVVEYINRRKVVIKCNDCGKVFSRAARMTTGVRCPHCYEKERQKHTPKRRRPHSIGNIRKRVRKYGAEYESGITLKKLYERDDGICGICGGRCNWSDKTQMSVGQSYPTIDHIVALANGGSHTWGNVQLAHHLCNSKKRDLEVSA